MSKVRLGFVALAASLVSLSLVRAQEASKPGPEHQKLMELAGTWDAVMKFAQGESKGTMIWKADLGGLWLTAAFEGDFGGQKFLGRGFDGYDPVKKRYVAVWIDSMSASPMVSEGTYDPAGKVMTMTGEGPGRDGKPTKYRMTTEHKDQDNLVWTMYGAGADGKEAALLTITYKRRK